MSRANEFSSSPTQTDISQGNWLSTRKRGRVNDEIKAAVETTKIVSAEKRRSRASKTPPSDIRDVGDLECARNETSMTQITNEVNQVQKVYREKSQKIKELTYNIQLQKAEIRLCRQK